MASGLPVIAPRSGGLLDFTQDGVHGLLFDPDDQAAFIAVVQRLLADRVWARQMGYNGRSHAESLSWAHVFEKLVADYQTLLQGYG